MLLLRVTATRIVLLLLLLIASNAAAFPAAPFSAANPAASSACVVLDISQTNVTLDAAQQQARAVLATAPCVNVLLGRRRFRLAQPFVLSAADSRTNWRGGEITTAVDVPAAAWQLPSDPSESRGETRALYVSRFVSRSEWGTIAEDSSSLLPEAHLSLLLQYRGVWRPMTIARWPNVPFQYGDVPPVNWTTISKACTCPGAPGGGCDSQNPPGE
jgi:hypothetical protein